MKKKNLIGHKFGRLKVVAEATERRNGRVYWVCECDCGHIKEISGHSLVAGITNSCGCLQRELTTKRFRKYGADTKKIRDVLTVMKQRCFNPQNADYYLYGGRGITVCDEWLDADKGVQNFIEWSLKNGYKEGLSIDRLDNSKSYAPDNCRWVTNREQNRNKRTNHILTYNGQSLCMAEWAEKTGIPYSALKARINKYGWTVNKALETPIKGGKNNHESISS